MKFILHIIEDKKFLKATINKFSLNPYVINIYILIGKFKYTKVGSAIMVSLPTSIINYLIPFIHVFIHGLVIHGFSKSFFNINFEKLHENINILGIFWGFDLYSINESKEKFLMAETRKMMDKNNGFSKLFGQRRFIDFINYRIDFVSTVVPTENEILENIFPKSRYKFTWFSYFDLENDVLNGIKNKQLCFTGKNLLLGNNASLWNNHLDSIELIKSFKFDFEDIICPLSYSGSKEYVNYVVKSFNKIFKGKFQPITKFLNYNDYLQILLSCPFVFFNSKRQIGLGNLLFSIYLGSVVILNNKNPLYHYFLSNGIKVFSIQEAQLNLGFKFDASENRKNLELLFNEEVLKKRTVKIIDNLIHK
ncbi:hypothetical protein GCM10027284_25310 [Cyclobacterium sediminis]